MEADRHLIKDCHSPDKKSGVGEGSKLLNQEKADKERAFFGEEELCGLANVTPFFPCSFGWKQNKNRKTRNSAQEVSVRRAMRKKG